MERECLSVEAIAKRCCVCVSMVRSSKAQIALALAQPGGTAATRFCSPQHLGRRSNQRGYSRGLVLKELAQLARGVIVNSYGTVTLTLLASILLSSTAVLGQVVPSGVQTIDLEQQLDIPLNNGLQGEDRNQADFLLRLGGQAQRRGFFDKAIANWLQALDIYQKIGDFQALGLTYEYLGVTYAKLGLYQQAEDALRRRIGLARSQEDFQGQIYGLNNLGTVFLQSGNLKAARETFTEALKIARTLKNQEGEGLSLSNLGLVAAEEGNYFEAIKRYETALGLRIQTGDPVGEANTRNNLGDAYRAVNSLREASTSYQGALRLAQSSRDVPNEFRAFRGLVQSYIARGEYLAALNVLEQHMALARKEKNLDQELFSLRLYAQAYQGAGNLPNARNFYEQAIALAGVLGDTQQQALLRNDLAQMIYNH